MEDDLDIPLVALKKAKKTRNKKTYDITRVSRSSSIKITNSKC
jgi:hypothetical protein